MSNSNDRGQLTQLRHGLLRLHKTLLDWERGAYEQVHGRQEAMSKLRELSSVVAVIHLMAFSGPFCSASHLQRASP